MGEVLSIGNLSSATIAKSTVVVQPLEALRNQGRADFVTRGLPTRRMETWKYSDLSQALGEAVRPVEPGRATLVVASASLAAFENGVLDETASTFEKIGALPLRPVLGGAAPQLGAKIGTVNPPNDHPIANLNAAVMTDGLLITVPKGVNGPLHLRFNWHSEGETRPAGGHLRILLEIEDGAEFTLVESHDGAPSFATIISEFKLGQGAQLQHLRLDRLGAAGRQSAMTLAEIGAAARYRAFYLSEGGHFARHEALLKLTGDAAQAILDGAYLVANGRHCDNTTVMDHAAPNTSSRQSFRGALTGRSRGVFQGCVRVAPEAQRTDACQMSRALLLSREAEIATKPELEIFADDVKCSHGATAGELDAQALFFLRARGIPEAEARALLVHAFLLEALDTIENSDLRDIAAASAEEWLTRHAGEINHVG